MLQIRIKENTSQGKAFAEFVKTLPFVEIVDEGQAKSLSKQQLLDDFAQSVREVKERKTKPLKNLLHGK
jgi:hypothetical protein